MYIFIIFVLKMRQKMKAGLNLIFVNEKSRLTHTLFDQITTVLAHGIIRKVGELLVRTMENTGTSLMNEGIIQTSMVHTNSIDLKIIRRMIITIDSFDTSKKTAGILCSKVNTTFILHALNSLDQFLHKIKLDL